MTCLEDQLFYACTNYCEALNHYKSTREEVIFSFNSYTDKEKEKILGYERGRVKHSVDRLTEILEKITGDSEWQI